MSFNFQGVQCMSTCYTSNSKYLYSNFQSPGNLRNTLSVCNLSLWLSVTCTKTTIFDNFTFMDATTTSLKCFKSVYTLRKTLHVAHSIFLRAYTNLWVVLQTRSITPCWDQILISRTPGGRPTEAELEFKSCLNAHRTPFIVFSQRYYCWKYHVMVEIYFWRTSLRKFLFY